MCNGDQPIPFIFLGIGIKLPGRLVACNMLSLIIVNRRYFYQKSRHSWGKGSSSPYIRHKMNAMGHE